MKLRVRLLTMALLPVIALGIFTYAGASVQLKNGIENQAYEGMEATTLAVREVFDSVAEGEYYLDEAGQMWKGGEINVSEKENIVDSIKENTGFDVTIFYEDTRVLTTITDADGSRQVGTKASDAIVEQVLNKGQDYKDDNTEIFGKRYICYYIPLYQENSQTPVGMIFLGEEYSKVESAIAGSRKNIAVIMLAVLVLVNITSLLSASSITSTIKGAIACVEQMCQGKLGVRASQKLLARKDEIGDMCRGLKKLDDNLIAVVTEIQVQTREIEETSSLCNGNAHKALESAEQVNAAAEEVAAATTTQAHGAVEAESSVNTIGQTIEEANQGMKSLSDTSQEMAQAAGSARQTLVELNTSMSEVKDAVDNIHHQTNETHHSVEKIGEMTEVISEIAEQTNLLSLNASIEAARAGEMGKGFAVVADEIRKLAEQSNTSAVEIQEVLTQLKNNSNESVGRMEEVQKIIKVQADKIPKTNQVFDTVESGIEKSLKGLDKIVKDISSLNATRDVAIDEVQNVATLAQQNAASIEETAASIDEVTVLLSAMTEKIENLKEVADKLEEKASVFELPG